MRNRRLFIYPCAFLLLSLSGCSSEEESKDGMDNSNLPTVVFSASFDNNSSGRTIIDNAGRIHWVAEDAINLNGATSTKTEILNEGTTALFTAGAVAAYSAVYPSSVVTQYANGLFTLALSEEQKYYNNNSFSHGENVSVAYNKTENKLPFKNVCGLLRMKLSSEEAIKDIQAIRFVSKDNPVAGTFTVKPETGVQLTAGSATAKSKKITFLAAQSISTSSDLTVTFVLPPAKYGAGWKLELLNSAGRVVTTKESSSAVDVIDSKITDLGVVTFVVSSNSYILASGNSLKIPVIRANESYLQIGDTPLVGGKCIQLAPSDSWTAEIIWEEKPGTITLSKNMGTGPLDYFTVKAQTDGNALVAVKKGGIILWSWHIWVADYDPEATAFLWSNGFVFMDRNIGAFSNRTRPAADGLFYQWGRKDPFPRSGVLVASSSTLGFTGSVRNPIAFIRTGHDWFGEDPIHQNDLWSGVGIAPKSVFDPCPEGWRVPTQDNRGYAFNGMVPNGRFNQGGFWDHAGKTIFFPASGFINHNTTEWKDVGTDGYYWTGNPVGTKDCRTFFFNNLVGLNPIDVLRGGGKPVRCCKE